MDLNFCDEEYKKCRNLVKQWELEFRKTNKRNPTKEDKSNAPRALREAYKTYWLKKTSFLEESILDDEDTVNIPKLSPAIEPEKKLNELQNSEQTIGNTNTVWGDHVNKPPVKDVPSKLKRSTSFQFSEKLFQGSNFKKRNPRKSLVSINRSKSSDVLPLYQETQECVIEQKQGTEDCVERGKDCSVELKSEQEQRDQDDSPISLNKSIKVTSTIPTVIAQPVNILQKIDDLKNIQIKTKLNAGWLERCNQTCNLNTYDTSTCDDHQISDDDYIPGSDDESSTNNSYFPRKILFNRDIESNVNRNTLPSCTEHLQPAVARIEQANVSKPTCEEKPTILNNVPIEAIEIPKTSKRVAARELPRPLKKQKVSVVDEEETRKINQLREKVISGKANENFVGLNMKKKIYARGKKTMTGAKYKKQQWKIKKKLASNSISSTDVGGVRKCFRCGDIGHFSKQCKKNNYLLPKEDIDDEEDSPFPTLEEAAEMVQGKNKEMKNCSADENNFESLEEFANLEEPTEKLVEGIPSLYEFNEDCIIDTPQEVFDALYEFGYQKFRPGQEETIMRILYGKSTLLISSTGSGKSLCYQIPAYLYAKKYRCISLIISPLVSLMEDQVVNFPKILPAACLHTNQTDTQRNQIMEKIKQNEIAVLLVSPEAMVSCNSPLNKAILKDFPPIAFACIDEVHCVSQWSHNFRTSYLMICQILRERFNIRTLLGLTATATRSTLSCIKDNLGIDDEEEGIIQDKILPDNLILSVSRDENRDRALVNLLENAPFCDYKSIIIYCIRRNECERLAALLRTVLKDTRTMEVNVKTRKTVSPDVEEYHAGLSAARRKRVQNSFMSGKLRIVVATVAFGMGINKSDIRGIIHYNMPRTYEHYVQEIGRAGRDGLPARCHLFLDSEGNDLPELKRHIFANSVDRHIIRKLLQNVFPVCECEGECKRHEIAFSVDNTIAALDLFQENITTLLCYLELLPEKIVQVLPPAYTSCTIQSYGGIRALKNAAKKCPPLAYAIAEHCKNSNGEIKGKLEFSAVELANKISWRSGTVKNELKQCEWTKVNDKPKKSGVVVEFHDLGFHVLSKGNLTPEQMNDAVDRLFSIVQSQEKKGLHQLQTCFETFHLYSFGSVMKTLESEHLLERNDCLKKEIRNYFSEDDNFTTPELLPSSSSNEVSIAVDVHRIVSSYKDCKFTGRSIAKIFYGIESPNFPAIVWSRSPFWRCGLKEDFNFVRCIANRELIKLK